MQLLEVVDWRSLLSVLRHRSKQLLSPDQKKALHQWYGLKRASNLIPIIKHDITSHGLFRMQLSTALQQLPDKMVVVACFE